MELRNVLLEIKEKLGEAQFVADMIDLVVESVSAKSGSDLEINASTGKDILLNLTDSGGARSVKVMDSSDVAVLTINSDGLLTANGGVVGNLTGNVSSSGANLTLTADTNRSIVLKVGDKIGSQKVLVKDTDDVTVASIDSDGAVVSEASVYGKTGVRTAYNSGNYEVPTNAECVSAFGAANTVGSGFIGVINDTGNSKVYIAVSNGSAYFLSECTAAAT